MSRKLSEIFPPCAFRFSTEPQIEAVRKSIYIGFILIDDELSVAPFPEKSMVHVRYEESEEDSDPLPHAYQVGDWIEVLDSHCTNKRKFNTCDTF